MKWLNKLRYIHPMEYYTAFKKIVVNLEGPIQKNMAQYKGQERQVLSHRTCILKPTYFKNMYLSLCESTHIA